MEFLIGMVVGAVCASLGGVTGFFVVPWVLGTVNHSQGDAQ